MSGVQVAVIAPTTLLARQHYKSFAETVSRLSRSMCGRLSVLSAPRTQPTRDGMSDGTRDIVIGTHALLAKSVRFRTLGF